MNDSTMKRHFLRAALTPFAVLMLGVGQAPATEKSAAHTVIAEKCSTCDGDRGIGIGSMFPISPVGCRQTSKRSSRPSPIAIGPIAMRSNICSEIAKQ